MAPNILTSSALFLAETSTESEPKAVNVAVAQTTTATSQVSEEERPKYVWRIVWRNVLAFIYLHIGSLYGFYLLFTACKLYTVLWGILIAMAGAMGITAGAHRLWCHRSYKAKWQLRLLLMIFQTLAFQNHITEWVRDHRVHHKFTDTDADPHNAKRGFFFSHMGWLMLKKHKDVKAKGQYVDLSDLEQDPIVKFQRIFYPVLMPIIAFAIPWYVPVRFWGEDPWVSWYTAAILRYTFSLNMTWLVNSAAHIYGTKPYDGTISPTDSLAVAIAAFGEGWHNYHHVFPWDYKAGEFPAYNKNFSTAFIDLMARIGWAYDLKTVPMSMIKKRIQRTGDGTHPIYGDMGRSQHKAPVEQIWGWGDKDMLDEDIADVTIINKEE